MRIIDHERLTSRFFRDVNSGTLFRRFFEHFGAWAAMGLDEAANGGKIYEAWGKLVCDNKPKIEEALKRVNDLARDKAQFALRYCAGRCGVPDFRDLTLAKLAMTIFLDHRSAFDSTYAFHTIEKTENLHTMIGLRPMPCDPSPERVDRFKAELIATLGSDPQRADGARLLVEVAPRHDKKWMAAIPHQTYAKADHEFVSDEEIATRDRRPVHEMVLIYYPDKGVLKVKAGRGRKKAEQVASCFATEILGQTAQFFLACDFVSFAPLLDPLFSFAPEPEDRFQWVRPTQIQYRRKAHPDFSYVIHCTDRRPDAPSVLDRLAEDGLSLHEIEIEGLSLCFGFPGGSRDTRTVDLTPSSSSLDETERDTHIEHALVRWEFINHAAKEYAERADVP